MTTTTSLEIRRLAGALGAEIRGVDLDALTPELFEELQAMLAEHLVLFFPGLAPTPEQHRDFAAGFGELEMPALPNPVVGAPPEVLVVPDQFRADSWHTDLTWREQPPVASVFHMVSSPGFGGDTMWMNTQQAYDELSAPMQEMLLGLTATHNGAIFFKPGAEAIHPVVRLHPVTGRKALYVNEPFTSHINELTPEESKVLLDYLLRHCGQPHLSVRHTWSDGDVCIWDNRSTQHIAVNDYGDAPRTAHRVTILGDNPQPAGELRHPQWVPERLDARVGKPIIVRNLLRSVGS